ncbi:MAG: neutral/alkaline non-lysosomal ceramidase N-terminal domain-containing protein, partial [Planctomycetota bacterium]|nr:neutral/alkaline non-lysosomal ceramidase N-terminal domain-containing protein [Planctomycetota bacterium]
MFRASAATVDLDPPVGGRMIGFSARAKPSTGVHDPIMARAVMLDDGRTKAVLVSCDLLGFEVSVSDEIRRRIGQACGTDASNVLLACTHTHSSPDSLASEADWVADAKERIVDMAGGLVPALKPARLSHGLTTVTGIGYNRESDQHQIDESLGVIGIDGADGQAIATIINYATHAVVLGPDNLEYSADFPGEVCRHVARLRGGVGIYLQGACGDVDPVVYRDRGWGTGTFDDTDEIGKKLAEAAAEALADVPAGRQGAPATEKVKIDAASKVIDVPLDAPPSQEEIDQVA